MTKKIPPSTPRRPRVTTSAKPTVAARSKPRTGKSSQAKTIKRSSVRKPSSPKPSLMRRLVKTMVKWCVLLGLILSIPFAAWVWWLDQDLVATFDGQKWQLPSEVYSAPIVLRTGDPWKKADLEKLLLDTGYRFGRNSQEIGWAARSTDKISAHLRAYYDHQGNHDSARRIFSFGGGRLQIQTINGAQVEQAILEPQLIGYLYAGNTEQREVLTFDMIPSELVSTLLAVEDKDYYQHFGISVTGIARALWVNVTQGGRRQGGSTITQQLIKNMYLSSERTYSRKLTEMVMAIILDYRFSKEAILTAYVNEIYLAQFGNKAIHGFAAASKHFFGRPLAELNTSEYALLVGMVKGPSLYNPRRNSQRAQERRDIVLSVLYEQALLSKVQFEQAKSRPIKLINERQSRSLYGDFLDLVALQLARDFDETRLATENLKIYTSLDIRVQQAAVSAMYRQVAQLVQADRKLKGLQGAIVVTDAQTGQVRALVGSSSEVYSGFNRALGAVRPIGSLVKPPLYLAALATGRFTWLSPLQDEAISIKVGHDVWQPENYDRKTHGTVPMYMALAQSYNLATLDLASQLGFDRLGTGLRQLGVERPFTMRPAVALGSLELSPFEVARLFQPIASVGESAQLGIVASVIDESGQVIKRFKANDSVPFTRSVLAITLDGMTKVAQLGTAKRAQAALPDVRFAAKTGTTNQQKDSWFVGITGDYSATIWLGDDANIPLSITGGTGAQKVWIDLMLQLNPKSITQDLPNGAERFSVSTEEYALAADRCEAKESLSFLTGTEPQTTNYCVWPF